MSSFLGHLKQRKITQWVLAYLAGAWLFLEVLGFIADHFSWPGLLVQGATITLGMGIGVVLVLAWFHGEKGHQRLSLVEGVLLGALLSTTLVLLFKLSGQQPSGDSPIAGESPVRSIAVLPFVNATGDPEQQYFSDGISEELINALARLPGLHVVARTSSFQFPAVVGDSKTTEQMGTGTMVKNGAQRIGNNTRGAELAEIARQLGVATLVEGSVRRAGDNVRVTAKLIDAVDARQIWSQSFDRQMTEIFAIQDEIAQEIATALHVQLVLDGTIEPSVPRAASIDAYNLYLLGRFHFEKRTVFELEQAQRYFEDAIDRDPLFAPAYNGLVDSILLQSDFAYGKKPLEQCIKIALPLIERSLKLDPLMAETHASLGFLRMFERDMLASEAALLRAIELSPNMSRAFLWLYITYQQLNQQSKAFETLKRTFALDPLSPIVNTNMAAEWWARGNNADAMQAAQRVVQIAPDGPLGYKRSGRIKWTSGELALAIEWYRQALQVAPDDANSKQELGLLMVDMGLYDEAEQLLGEQRYSVYLAQGRIEEALEAARAVLVERPTDSPTIIATARTEMRAGNFDRAQALLEPLHDASEPGVGPLYEPLNKLHWDPQVAGLDLATALLQNGNREAGLELLKDVKNHFALLQADGFSNPMLSYQEARVLALEGNLENALEVLRKTVAAGFRSWSLDEDPALRNLWEHREFQSIIGDRDRLVEQERIKLLGG